jgi:hypothetical protein
MKDTRGVPGRTRNDPAEAGDSVRLGLDSLGGVEPDFS